MANNKYGRSCLIVHDTCVHDTCVGSNPSQFQGVGGSEMIEGIEAFNDCSAFDVECCYGLDRR